MSPQPTGPRTFPIAIPKPPPGKSGVPNPNTPKYVGVTKRIEMVKPDQCTIDLEVQRPRDQGRINALAAKWNDVAAGVCYVSRRTDGTTIILDGQTRFGALQVLGLGDRPRETIVYRGLSKPQEAEIFRILNNTKKPDAVTLFNIGCVEEVEENLKIRELVREYGYEPARGPKNALVAVVTLVQAYRRDPVSLEETLKFCHTTWGTMKDAVNGVILAGLSLMIFRYGPAAIDFRQLSDRVRKGAGGDPTSLIGRAKTNAGIRSCGLPDAMADVLVNIYNKGPGQKKLPDWVTGK